MLFIILACGAVLAAPADAEGEGDLEDPDGLCLMSTAHFLGRQSNELGGERHVPKPSGLGRDP